MLMYEQELSGAVGLLHKNQLAQKGFVEANERSSPSSAGNAIWDKHGGEYWKHESLVLTMHRRTRSTRNEL